MPLPTPNPQNFTGGTWGTTPFPPWMEQYFTPQMSFAQKANKMLHYMGQHPDYDFGPQWNAYRQQATSGERFYEGQIGGEDDGSGGDGGDGNTQNQANTYNAATNTTTGNNPLATGFGANNVTSARPTQPGGPEPGRWQRLVSIKNGVRQERWVWKAEPVAPTPVPPVATVDPSTVKDPNQLPPPPPADVDTSNSVNPGGWQQTQQTPPINPQQNGLAGQQSQRVAGKAPAHWSTPQLGYAPSGGQAQGGAAQAFSGNPLNNTPQPNGTKPPYNRQNRPRPTPYPGNNQ